MTDGKISFPTTDKEIGDLLVGAIKQKKIVIFPVETCYGICFDVLDEELKKRVYEIKKRPTDLKFPGIVPSEKKLALLGIKFTPLETKFIKKYWPGQLTIAFTDDFAAATPSGKWFIDILERINTIICGTSANLSGRPPTRKYKDLDPELVRAVDLVIVDDSKNIHDNVSTVVRLKDKVEVLRQGVIDVSEYT